MQLDIEIEYKKNTETKIYKDWGRGEWKDGDITVESAIDRSLKNLANYEKDDYEVIKVEVFVPRRLMFKQEYKQINGMEIKLGGYVGQRNREIGLLVK